MRSASLLLLLAAATARQDPAEAQVRSLASEDIETRETAAVALKRLGVEALPALRKAAAGADEELAAAARRLIRAIEIRARLGEALLKARPGAEDRLAESAAAWTRELLTAAAEHDGRRAHPSLESSDLDPLAARAIEGADAPATLIALLEVCGRRYLRSAGPACLTLTRHPSAAVRAAACRCLGDLHYAPAAERLPELLKDPAPEVRSAAARTALDLDARGCSDALLELLGTAEGELRDEARRAIAFLSAPTTLRTLIERAAAQGVGYEDAVWILRRTRPEDPGADLAPLLESKDDSLRALGAELAGRWGQRKAGPALLRLLGDPDDGVAAAAARAASRLGEKDALPALTSLMGGERPEPRRAAGKAVWALDPDAARAATARLAASELPGVAGDALDSFRDGHGLDAFRAAAKGNAGLRRKMPGALARVAGAAAAAEIRAFLSDPDEDTRRAALRALGFLRAKAFAGDVAALLDVEPLRHDALRALARIGDSGPAVRVLKETDSTDSEIARSAFEALASMRATAVAKDVKERLPRVPSDVRSGALSAWAACGGAEALGTLLDGLKDPDAKLRIGAVGALGWIDDPRATAALLGVLKGGAVLERDAARKALLVRRPKGLAAELRERLLPGGGEVARQAVLLLRGLGERPGPDGAALVGAAWGPLRVEAGRWLLEHGDRRGAPPLLEEFLEDPEPLCPLAAMSAPDTWARLRGRPFPTDAAEGAPIDLAREWARRARLRISWEAEEEEGDFAVVEEGTSLLDAFAELPLPEDHRWVLEEGVARVLPRRAAYRHWRAGWNRTQGGK